MAEAEDGKGNRIDWLLTSILAITLSIVANFATDYIREIQARYDQSVKQEKLEEVKNELEKIERYFVERDLFQEYLLWSSLKISSTLAFLALLISFGVLIKDLRRPIDFIGWWIEDKFNIEFHRYILRPFGMRHSELNILSLVVSLVSIVGFMTVISTSSETIDVYEKVNNFSAYKDSAINRINELSVVDQ